jgi:hypothetical protein
MIQHILKQIILVALINMSLFVPQFDLVPGNYANEVSNTIETHVEAVDSIATLIYESISGIDIPFPIHDNAHFLEKDFVVKRVLKNIPIFSKLQGSIVGYTHLSVKTPPTFTRNFIVLSKFFGFIASLHYF